MAHVRTGQRHMTFWEGPFGSARCQLASHNRPWLPSPQGSFQVHLVKMPGTQNCKTGMRDDTERAPKTDVNDAQKVDIGPTGMMHNC